VSARLVVTMDTTHSFQPPPADPAQLTAEAAAMGGSFWTGAPKVLAAFATILGSIVALTTVLVQAGVIGSSRTAPGTPTTLAAARTTPAQTATLQTPVQATRAAVPAVEMPSLGKALADLNELLAESARTKGDLGKLIVDVQPSPPAIGRTEALGKIDEIVRQREQLHAELASLPAPAPLSTALALLRDSITASLADDRLVRQWIVAHYDGNGAADSLWQAQLEASRAASEAKRAFRAEYADRLATSGLSGFIPDY